MRHAKPTLMSVLAIATLAACSSAAVAQLEPDEKVDAEPMLAAAGIAHVRLAETFVTASTVQDNIDSPASWAAPEGSVMLLATAKATGRLMRYDGDTGVWQGVVGAPGTGPGQFNRPNGIFIEKDLLFVVERDNHRVQVLRLPELSPLGSFGASELKQPYGIWVQAAPSGGYDVVVTDAYMAGEDAQGEAIVPPLSQLGDRVRRYRVVVDQDGLAASEVGTFGDTGAEGAIRVPESIWADPAHKRFLIAEEDLPTGTAVREYTFDGAYAGRTLGLGLFKAQAEGLALWSCPDGSGYWLGTDQFKDHTLFHVFDRKTLEHVGAFAGQVAANTDGIWLHQSATRRFPNGVFYAVHDDQAVAAFDWRDIAAGLKLRQSCAD